MDSPLNQARSASRDAVVCLDTIKTLQAMEFPDAAFRLLHHQRKGMDEFCRYSHKKWYRDDGNNHRVHQRLMYVLLSCREVASPKGKSFEGLAEEAYREIPPVAR